MKKIILAMLLSVISESALAFDTLDSTLSILKKTGIEAGGMDYICPDGFATSKELSAAPKSFSQIDCVKKINTENEISIQVESIVPAKKNKIGRIFISTMKIGKNEKRCTAEDLKKFILPRKPTSVINQYFKFDLGKDIIASVACAGVGSGYMLDIKTKIWSEIMK